MGLSQIDKEILAKKLREDFFKRLYYDSEIDEIVSLAKSQIEAERNYRNIKYRELEKLFDRQIETSGERGCPKDILGFLRYCKAKVLAMALKMNFEKNRIPFLPIIGISYAGLYGLVRMIKLGNKAGITTLEPDKIYDRFTSHTEGHIVGIYYIFDVEDGTMTCDKSSLEAEDFLEKQSRRPLNVAEMLSLAIHTDIISRLKLIALGSHYENTENCLQLAIEKDCPHLEAYGIISSWKNPQWGYPSCSKKDYF